MPRARQRGAVLLFSLIVLVIMLISAVSLMRSFDVSLATSGNLAFKRDLAQHSEQAAETLLEQFRSGGALVTSAGRANNVPAQNYSATVLASNPQGIPLALLSDTAFAAVGSAADINAGDSVTLRYVVDRLCTAAGEAAERDSAQCTLADATVPAGGSSSNWERAEHNSGAVDPAAPVGSVATPVVFRLSIRATGPRNTQSFFQTTFSCCDG